MTTLIKDMLEDEKPREKAKKYGIRTLSNVDLLALLFRTGKKNESVMDLSRRVLKQFDNFEHIENLRYAFLSSLNGIGEAKALSLMAALELGRRVYFKKEKEELSFSCASDVYSYYCDLFKGETQEKFMCIFLNIKNVVLDSKVIFIGTINKSLVYARDIFREALLNNAAKIICVHNHPSGNFLPSLEDGIITRKLCEAGKLIGIEVADHIILGKNNYYSFLEHEEMN